MTELALMVVGNGRLDYLLQAVSAAFDHLPQMDYYLMVDDSGSPQTWDYLDDTFRLWTIDHHSENRGMAAAVQSGFNMIRHTDAEAVFWLEEDMLLTCDPPIHEAIDALIEYPTLAQMCFRREPWWGSPKEMQKGDQLSAIVDNSPLVNFGPHFTMHRHLFSLNPCLIPRVIFDKYDWPAGPIGTGNETGMTHKLIADDWWFGSWGHPGDGSCWARHIGQERGSAWQL